MCEEPEHFAEAFLYGGIDDQPLLVRTLQFADSTVPRDLVRQVGERLTKKVKKIKVVDEREVSEWTDENSWQKFTEVGKALKADMVVGIELERFSLQQGPLSGSKIRVRVCPRRYPISESHDQ